MTHQVQNCREMYQNGDQIAQNGGETAQNALESALNALIGKLRSCELNNSTPDKLTAGVLEL